jgi:uncharacterized protein
MRPPRHLPLIAWPAYAYLPGRDPHPVLHEAGHSFGQREIAPAPVHPDCWSTCILYLRGVDLYNHGFHWEAHEVWEALWNAAYDDVQHDHLQGLIQAAAAAVQQRLGHEQGRARLASRAVARLRRVRQERGETYMGVELEDFASALESFAGSGNETPLLLLIDRSRPGTLL